LPGTDGERRMSKTLDNYIGVTEPPEEMYGKTMRIPDSGLDPYYRLLLGEPPPASAGPRDAKRALARALVGRFHDPSAADAAEQHFDRLHVERRPPEDIEDAAFEPVNGTVHLPALLETLFGLS